jgi:DNA-binding MarR family transcriptional regulator
MDARETIKRDLMMLWFLMGQQRRGSHREGFVPHGQLDPTRGRGRIIAMLKIKDGLSAKELSHVLGIRVSSLNETLSKMEKDGLIVREPSEADKRVLLIYLTDEGREVEVGESEELDILAGFSDDEIDQLSKFISRMVSNAESGLDKDVVKDLREEWEARERLFSSMGGPFGGGGRPSWGGGPGGFGPRMRMMQ